MRGPLALALFLSLSACAPKPAPQAAWLDLDCTKPFDVHSAAIKAQPGLVPAGEVGSEPYSYYSTPDGRVSYLITRKGSPAHPAIMIQKAQATIATTGCAYGSRKGYDQLLAYLESLKTWRRQ